jgi:cbb3-type cytochrome oxidase maturation protein
MGAACAPARDPRANYLLPIVFAKARCGHELMNYLFFLVPLAILMGFVGLVAFLWSARSGQYEDLDGAAERIFLNDDDKP